MICFFAAMWSDFSLHVERSQNLSPPRILNKCTFSTRGFTNKLIFAPLVRFNLWASESDQKGSFKKKYRKTVRWCASLSCSLYWLIWLIWIGFLDLWVDWTDIVHLIGWLNEWIQNVISVDVCQYSVSHGFRYYTRINISHDCRFHEILHKIQNISWLSISWDITPESKYLMVADFMRYYTRIKISHGCRFDEILHQNQNISWL